MGPLRHQLDPVCAHAANEVVVQERLLGWPLLCMLRPLQGVGMPLWRGHHPGGSHRLFFDAIAGEEGGADEEGGEGRAGGDVGTGRE
jgi:hypothetical protein